MTKNNYTYISFIDFIKGARAKKHSSTFSRFIIFFLIAIVPFASQGQVTARFTMSDTAGCAPLIVHFTNTSTGATSYSWNLGNSTLSTLTDVSTSYTSAGTYTVTLVASNGSVTNTYTKLVVIHPQPTVNFTASDTAICPGSSTIFTSTSTPGMTGGLTYNWNFGDGFFSAATGPSHVYAAPGFYTVSLLATNSAGCASTLSRGSYIRVVNRPNVRYRASDSVFCAAPGITTLTNMTTGSSPFVYLWRFGDGTTSTATNPSHTYGASGGYNVTLRVTDRYGCIDSLVKPSYMNVGNLTAAFTSVPTACIRTGVNFTNTSSPHVSALWRFGDGGTSTLANPAHAYTATGTYSIKLRVFDGACYDSVTRNVTITGATGTFTITPTNPCPAPVALTFNATVPAGCTVTWLFGDTTMGSGNPITHTYNYAVIDTQRMVVTDPMGCKDSVLKYDTSHNLIGQLSATPTVGCIPLVVNFNSYFYSSIYNPATTAYDFFAYPFTLTSYTWNFGDGSPTSTALTPAHTFTAVGTYTVTLTVTTANGCTKVERIKIIAGAPPVASFNVSPSSVCGGKPVTFTSTSTGAVSYYWRYGDISADSNTSSTMVHRYSTPGTYNTSLTVYNNGCPSAPFYRTVIVDSPVAVMHVGYACIPNNQVRFTNYSFGASSLLWLFGDGSTSTAVSPVHSYSALAAYTAVLTTFNATSGCRDTATAFIDLRKPYVNFITRDSTICRDQIDTFTSSFSSTLFPIGYKWYLNGTLVDSINKDFRYTYRARGVHSIMLVIKDSHGCNDTLIRNNCIVVAKPIANFNFSPTSGCLPVHVNFTDLSTDVPGTFMTNRAWTYGDGGTFSTPAAAAIHSYTANGTYAPKLIVTDNIGCMDTLTTGSIAANKPEAAFTIGGGTNLCIGTNVVFTNTSIGAVSSYWQFGDGFTSTATSPSHVYATSGSFTVTLIVTDAFGCKDTLSQPGYFTVSLPPVASFYMSDSFAVCPPLNCFFTNTSTGAATYSWTFGDGNSSVAFGPSNTYVVPGHYTVKLVATNAFGCSDSTTGHAVLFGYSGAFSYTPTEGCAPLPVSFTATFSGVSSIIWDFSDGVISSPTTVPTINHTYNAAGYYRPKLILTDSSGCSAFSIGSDSINVDTLIPGIRFSPSPVCQYYPATFIDSSYSYFSSSTAWAWTYGPGITSSAPSPSYTYTASGTYPVRLTVTNANGCVATVTKSVTVVPAPMPITGIFSICTGSTTSLTDGTPGGTWSSSNPSVATINSTGLVTAVSTGTTVISYIAGTGCPATASVVVNPAPAAITGPSSVCGSLTIALSDATPGGVWSSATPANGTVSTTGVVTGLAPGVATISYSFGSACAVSKTITVNPLSAIIGPTAICNGLTTTFSDATPGGTWSSSAPGIASIVTGSGFTTGLSLGATVISYALPSGCTATSTLTVNPVPGPIAGPSQLCSGTTITLSDGVGGTWSSSIPSIASIGSLTGIVTGVAPGMVTITYSLGAGCTVTTTVLVKPSPAPIAGVGSVCQGSFIILSDATVAGTWSSSSTGIATIGVSSGIVSGVSPGNSVILYLLTNGCSATKTITVNPVPPAITGITKACVGLTSTLINAGGGTWSSTSPGIASIGVSSGVVTGMASGTSTIIYAYPTGCRATITFTVNPLPLSISGSPNVCAGSTVTLSDATPGGTWSTTMPTTARIDSVTGVVTGISSGLTTVTYTLPTGCIATRPITVNAVPPPIYGVSSICHGGTTTLSDLATGGIWNSSDPTKAFINSSTGDVVGVSPGTVAISYTIIGLSSCPALLSFTVNPLPAPITGNTTACIGLITTLSDADAGGAWSSSNPGVAFVGPTSGFLTGVTAGSVIITYTLPTGCAITRPQIVNPTPVAITGPTRVCEGLTVSLSDATPGGIWSSSNPSVADIGTGSGIVTGITGGSVLISYTKTGCSALLPFLVNPLPAPITGAGNICGFGATIHVSDSTPAGIWTSAYVTVSPLGIVTGYTGGIASVTYTLPTGCLRTATLTVHPYPGAITGINTVCIGYTTVLSDSTLGGLWTSDDTSIARIGATTGLVNAIAPGVSNITYTAPTGCPVTTTVTVTPVPAPIIGPVRVCAGSTISLSDSVGVGLWTSSSPAIATAGSGSGVVTGVAAGIANITYTLSAGCIATSSITVLPLPAIYVVSGGGNLCVGGTGVRVGLTNSMAGFTYQLYLGTVPVGTPVPGAGAPLDFGIQTAPGTYTVIAVNSTTGCAANMFGFATVTTTPSVVPAVTIAPTVNDTICADKMTLFTATPVNGGSAPDYQWNVNGMNVGINSSTYSYVPVNGDLVKVTMNSNATCAIPPVAMNTITTTVETPIAPIVTIVSDPAVILTGQTVTFTALVSGEGYAPSYQWNINKVPVPGANGITFTTSALANKDTVSCTVTKNNFCVVAATNWIPVVFANVGVNNVSALGSELRVVPNPNKGMFTIQGTLSAVTNDDVLMEVRNVLGQIVYKDKVIVKNGTIDQQVVLGKDLANGTYMLTVHTGSDNIVFHIVLDK